MISFVIPSYQRADGAIFMILNLLHQTVFTKYPTELILSIDETDTQKELYANYIIQAKKIAQEIVPACNISLLVNQTKGLVAAKNNAVRASKYEFIMMLDDDLAAVDNYVEALLADMKAAPSVGAISGFIVSYLSAISHTQPSDFIEEVPKESHLQTLKLDSNNGAWRTFFGKKEQVMDWSRINKNIPSTVRYTMDYFVNSYLFRRSAYNKIGGYSNDLNSKTSAHEEVDFTYRMRKAGYQLLFNPFVQMWHITVGHGGIYKGADYNESKEILEKEYKESIPLFVQSISR